MTRLKIKIVLIFEFYYVSCKWIYNLSGLVIQIRAF